MGQIRVCDAYGPGDAAGYLRHYNDPVVAAKVMESAEAIYRDQVLYKGEEARLQNWRVQLFL